MSLEATQTAFFVWFLFGTGWLHRLTFRIYQVILRCISTFLRTGWLLINRFLLYHLLCFKPLPYDASVRCWRRICFREMTTYIIYIRIVLFDENWRKTPSCFRWIYIFSVSMNKYFLMNKMNPIGSPTLGQRTFSLANKLRVLEPAAAVIVASARCTASFFSPESCLPIWMSRNSHAAIYLVFYILPLDMHRVQLRARGVTYMHIMKTWAWLWKIIYTNMTLTTYAFIENMEPYGLENRLITDILN